jgi:4-diphosphocytidyl-2-C-methyl-D-erythritol kinase
MSLPQTIVERARAKVNLTLSVRGRRGDGYHELESLVAFADVHDTVTLEPGAACSVAVAGPWAQDIAGENLLARALALLREADPTLRLGAVHLEKNLPVAAGLGGGSSDAAALLRAVRRANAEPAHDAVPWLEIAAQLGSDVPVCFLDRPALIWGRGERMAALSLLPAMPAVLVNPRKPLATGPVFAALRSGVAAPTTPTPPVPELPELSATLDYMRMRGNDLRAAAVGLMPEIEEIEAVLAAQAGCRMVAMSGSGPTCFAVFSTPADAERAAARVAQARASWWVVCTTLAGTAPATA